MAISGESLGMLFIITLTVTSTTTMKHYYISKSLVLCSVYSLYPYTNPPQLLLNDLSNTLWHMLLLQVIYSTFLTSRKFPPPHPTHPPKNMGLRIIQDL